MLQPDPVDPAEPFDLLRVAMVVKGFSWKALPNDPWKGGWSFETAATDLATKIRRFESIETTDEDPIRNPHPCWSVMRCSVASRKRVMEHVPPGEEHQHDPWS